VKRKINILESIDKPVLFIYLVLVFMGWISIYAAGFSAESGAITDFSTQNGKQLIWIGLAFFIAVFIMFIDYRVIEFFGWMIYPVMIFLLVVVLLFGTEVKGNKSWIDLGGFRLQPAEFTKVATALVLAKVLGQTTLDLTKFKDLLITALVIMLPMAIILLQNDTGSALCYLGFVFVFYREGMSPYFLIAAILMVIFFVISMILGQNAVMIIIAAIPLVLVYLQRSWFDVKIIGYSGALILLLYFWQTFFGGPVIDFEALLLIYNAVLVVYIVVRHFLLKITDGLIIGTIMLASVLYTFSVNYIMNSVLEKHQRERIEVLLGQRDDPLGAGYNVTQSKIAIGSGGIFGKGFLNGTQTKYDFVPEQTTDFIYCTIGEEWGFLGSALVLSLFAFMIVRIMKLSEEQTSPFARIYGYCVASILFIHFGINIAMTMGLAPVIGIPLPFFSYGGSSLWGFTIMLFIFLRLDASKKESLV